MDLREKLQRMVEADPETLCSKDQLQTTLGSDLHYLEDVFGLTKRDLKRLEKKGLAVKTRYPTQNKKRPWLAGPHRVRWVIFKEVLDESVL